MFNIVVINKGQKTVVDSASNENEAWDLCYVYANKFAGLKVYIVKSLN
jgi:hypothetical protein